MRKMYIIDDERLSLIQQLFKNAINNQYVILYHSGELVDIAQYSTKYMSVHINTIPIRKLNPTLQLNSKGYY